MFHLLALPCIALLTEAEVSQFQPILDGGYQNLGDGSEEGSLIGLQTEERNFEPEKQRSLDDLFGRNQPDLTVPWLGTNPLQSELGGGLQNNLVGLQFKKRTLFKNKTLEDIMAILNRDEPASEIKLYEPLILPGAGIECQFTDYITKTGVCTYFGSCRVGFSDYIYQGVCGQLSDWGRVTINDSRIPCEVQLDQKTVFVGTCTGEGDCVSGRNRKEGSFECFQRLLNESNSITATKEDRIVRPHNFRPTLYNFLGGLGNALKHIYFVST